MGNYRLDESSPSPLKLATVPTEPQLRKDPHYSWLRHVCNGILLSHDPEKTLVTVVAGKSVYLDDSGHPVDKPFFVLGGLIASEAKWIEFGEAWNKTLRSRQLESPFHAADFFFRYRNDRKLRHITADLVRTITNYAEHAFSVGLDMEVYKAMNREKRLEECAGSPIAVVSRCLRGNVEHWKELSRDGSPIHYFIESGTFQRGDMMEVWKHIDNEQPPLPVPKSHPSAQAADLYAHSVFQSAPFERGRLSWQHQIFTSHAGKTFGCFDTRVIEEEMKMYVTAPSTIINGRRVPIPGRVETEGQTFEFEGNKNKQQSARRARIGLDRNDRTSEV